jgi:hypothetical protein
MTSDVKGCQPTFLGLHRVFFPRCIGRDGASTMRRLILLLSVGWVPPYLLPSGACLSLGLSVLYKPPNAAEDDTTPGLRLCRCTLENLSEFNDSTRCVPSRADFVLGDDRPRVSRNGLSSEPTELTSANPPQTGDQLTVLGSHYV